MPREREIRQTCPDCGVAIGELHTLGCDVERCMICGGQLLSCGCKKKSRKRQQWTGYWPFTDVCRKFNLWSKMTEKGWTPCDKDDPEAGEDLNTLYEKYRWDPKKQEWYLPEDGKTKGIAGDIHK